MLGVSKRLALGLWRRRWFRRITYLLATGAVVGGAGLWTLRQPFFNRWLLGKLETYVLEETGLDLEVQDLEFHVVQGRIVLRNLILGGDLLRADRLEVQVDFITLLGRNPHIWNIELENPRSILDAQRLSRIRLKHHPDSGVTPLVRLDRVKVTGGRLRVQEPAWRVPDAEFTYRITGKGLGPNRMAAELHVPWFGWGSGAELVNGSMQLKANLSDLALELKDGEVKLGRNAVSAKGSYAFKERVVASEVSGRVDLAQALRILDPKAPRTWEGMADFKADVRGTIADPAWNVRVRGQGVSARSLNLQPAETVLQADGSFHHLNIRELAWNSSQGRFSATGQWKKGEGSQLAFHGQQVGLAPVAALSRVAFLNTVSLDLDGDAEIPGDPWVPPQWDSVKVTANGRFMRDGVPVGKLDLVASDGLLSLDNVDLRVPEIEATGKGTLELGKSGFQSIHAEATARTDAALVADVLHAWDIGEGREGGKAIKLGMGGKAEAQATLDWTPGSGVALNGHAEVTEPRWHGATMDRLRADVAIQDDELRIDNVEAEKGSGKAGGSLWLTWRDVPPGQDQIDMCFQAFRLPIEEGLRAGDVGDLPITGTGSGWARIHGPYDRIRVEAGGVAERATVYGFQIPYASGDMDYDIMGDRLVIRNARVAEKAELLHATDEDSSGRLALQGGMDMDLRRETWQVWTQGNLDSKALGLPGPRFQAHVDGRLEGPWVGSFGPVSLPSGTVAFQRGRLFLDQQSLDGLEGQLEVGEGALGLKVGVEGKETPFLGLEAWPKGPALAGALDVHLGPDSVYTAHLATRLTGDLLKDGGLDLQAEGVWDGSGLAWQGSLDRLEARFDGFDMTQPEPARLKGDASGMELDMRLLGAGTDSAERAAELRIAGKIPFSTTSPLGVALQGTAEVAHLKDILDHVLEVDEFSLMADLKPEGKAQFDLTLGGTLPEPMLDGLLSLKEGRLQLRTFPQSIEDLAFNMHFKGRDAILLESDPLRGRLAQGDLRAWGTITWELGGIAAYDLQTRLSDFQWRDVPVGFELYGDLDAVLQGTKEEGGILSGTLNARHMLYEADINLRDLILASATGGTPLLRAADPNDPLARIELDLDLVLRQPWEFDTNLLKLQGRPVGAFKVQGTLAEPGLKGKMEILPGGRLTNFLPAGDVVLERGSIEWTNPQVRYPNLDMQGRVDIPPYVVNLAIRGNLDGLEMKQTATPSLRQDEITAILIDPSLAPNIGSLSGPASQTAINYGLANTGSGLVTTLALANFQESVRRAFGLDRVSVAWRTGSGTGSPETSVTVGKSVDLFGHRTPVVLTHQTSGGVSITSGQVEWRFGNLVLLLGVSQSGTNGIAPSGEIRHTWSPGW